jgi:uncharacterized protein YmfQ (DUF2313 family)
MTTAETGQLGALALAPATGKAETGQLGALALAPATGKAETGQLGALVWFDYFEDYVTAQLGAMAFATTENPAGGVAQAGILAMSVSDAPACTSHSGILAWVDYTTPPPPIFTPPNTSPLKLTALDFLAAFQRLMPRGKVWPRDADATQTQALAGLMPTYVRSQDAANGLLVDAFPATAVQLLPEWEYTLGLPDPCAGLSPSIGQRQAQVVARLTGRGKNQSPNFFINFAATLGYAITITQFSPFRSGKSAAGDPANGIAWAFAWQINAPQFTIEYFRAGEAAGEPLASWGTTVLQCEMQRLAPANTVLMFNYS